MAFLRVVLVFQIDPGDVWDVHVHVALWLPANLAGSEAMGLTKSYTSRLLRREFPELKGHDEGVLWQRGGFVGGIGNGGDLSTVLAYIKHEQAVPSEQNAV